MIRILVIALLLWSGAAKAQYAPDPYRAGFTRCVAGVDAPIWAGGRAMLQACIGQASSQCQSQEADGGTTVGMMFCAAMEDALWDELLNDLYAELVQTAKARDAYEAQRSNGAFANLEQSLRDAQRAWIAFRDADCALAYASMGSGTMRQIEGAACTRNHTATRVIDLLALRETMSGH